MHAPQRMHATSPHIAADQLGAAGIEQNDMKMFARRYAVWHPLPVVNEM